jgi:hypothetical protein
MLVATHRKTIARCIANVFANLSPVFGDAIFSRLIIKKAVYIPANDNVQIQIKNIPFQVAQWILPQGDFPEGRAVLIIW